MRFIAVRIAWLGTADGRGRRDIRLRTGRARHRRGCPREGGHCRDACRIVRGETIRVDPEEAAERALIGGLVGGVLGVGSRRHRDRSIRPSAPLVGGSAGAAVGSCHRHRDDAAAAQLHPDRGPGRACHPRLLRHLASGICGAAERVAGAAAAIRVAPGIRGKARARRRSCIRRMAWPQRRPHGPLHCNEDTADGGGCPPLPLPLAAFACRLPGAPPITVLRARPLGAPPITASRALPGSRPI